MPKRGAEVAQPESEPEEPYAWVPDYVAKTTDHYPVLTRYDLR